MGQSSGFSKLALVGIIILVFGMIIAFVGIASPFWVRIDVESIATVIYFGLYQSCYEISSVKTCNDFFDTDLEWIKACQAFGILTLISLIVAVTFAIIGKCIKKDQKVLSYVACGSAIAGCVFCLVCVIIFGAKVNSISDSFTYTDYYHGSFGLTVVSIFLVAGGAAVLSYDTLKDSSNAIVSVS